MQPQPPEPSSVEPSPDAQAAEPVSEQPSPASRNFLQRLFRGRGSQESESQESETPAETSSAITLTQEELDRRVQAETDRRESRRQQAAQAERRRKLRDEDPWQFAQEERDAETFAVQEAQSTQWLSNVGATHDRFTVDPVVMALPEAERNRILAIEGAGRGLEGRKLIVTEAMKALERHWKEEGEKQAQDKLRRNPAFRKQVLNEFRRGGISEPEFVGSGQPSAGDRTVSDLLRNQIRARH